MYCTSNFWDIDVSGGATWNTYNPITLTWTSIDTWNNKIGIPNCNYVQSPGSRDALVGWRPF